MAERSRGEEWRSVVGWEGLYEVSNFGRVRSLRRAIPMKDGRIYTCGGKLLNQFKHHGYYVVRLRYQCTGKIGYVHRLVAEAFLPNPANLEVVNHKDENTLNNNVDNLEWCTNVYNLHYGMAHQKANEKRRKRALETGCHNGNSVKVILLDTNGFFVKSFLSISAAARFVGLKWGQGVRKKAEKNKIYRGYQWIF